MFAKEFGWTPEQVFDRTLQEIRSLMENLQRVNCESARYTAIAFNDPKRLSDMLTELADAKLSERERWIRGMNQVRSEVRRAWH